jgi:elongation factor G
MSDAGGTRCVALVGPYLSGKTTLLESLLYVSGGVHRRGSVKEGNSVGDSAPEARARQMSVELSVGSTEYLGDKWTILDCPGSIELFQDAVNALMVCDMAIVVFEPSTDRVTTLAPLFKFLDDHSVPHMLLLNKMDTATEPVLDVYQALRQIETRPLVLRQIPIRDGENIIGYVDLVNGRAYKYTAGEASEVIDIPADMADEYEMARTEMLEALSDFDDSLLEKLLEDEIPSADEIYGHLTTGVREGNIVPVFIGAAEHDYGARRILKALRHETPDASATAARLGLDGQSETMAQVFKTYHAQHAGKLSLARVWSGTVTEGMTLNGERVGSLLSLMGGHQNKIDKAVAGDVAALGRMDGIKTGDVLTPSGKTPEGIAAWPAPLGPVYARAIEPENRQDEVKLTGALQRLNEEDPSVTYQQNADTREMVLLGQGEIHLLIAIEKLKSRYNVGAVAHKPKVPYKETIQKTVSQHGRFKRQTGGHGMFGDVHVDIAPRPRGAGFEFVDKIVGGAIPRQFIPAVEAGIKEFSDKGPLGFPVVDFGVTLTDGQFHAVDSNEMSFKLAARVAMSEGMPKCAPVLLEPISKVEIDVPADYTNKVHGLISGRRGQILGFAPKEGWKGWDSVQANMPTSEIQDLIIELRSLSVGVGTYRAEFDHLQELTGRLADQVIEAHAEEKAES